MPKGRGGAREGRRWGGVFFRKQPRKDKREPSKHELYKKLGMEGGGRGGRRDTEIIVLRY